MVWCFAQNIQVRPKIYTPKRDNEHPRPFHMGVPPPPPGFSCYYSSMKQNDYVRMTFPENSSFQFIRTAPLSMVTLNTESQNPRDCLYVKSPGNHGLSLQLLWKLLLPYSSGPARGFGYLGIQGLFHSSIRYFGLTIWV